MVPRQESGSENQRTLFFTDIESSTRYWEAYPQQMAEVLAWHDQMLCQAVEKFGGSVFKRVGDGVCAIFDSAVQALGAAIAVQRTAVEAEENALGIRIRVVLHTGAVYERMGDYFGGSLSAAARILRLSHGGQTVISRSTYDLLSHARSEAEFVDLGLYSLKGLSNAQRIYQVNCGGLPSDFPALRGRERNSGSLPNPVTSFIGRAEEIDNLLTYLQHGRVVTIVGSGGIGKTRLAVEAATRISSSFPDGIWFVALEAINDPNLILQEIAVMFGFSDSGVAPLADRLLEYLFDQKALVVLDNCEHLLKGCASFVQRISSRCPNITVLATSREVLGVPGELVARVRPLTTPSLRNDIGKPLWEENAPQIQTFEAVRLFLDRALHANPSFRVTERNLGAVCDITSRLDGIPLAIELAAARARTLTAEQLLSRLDNAFTVCGIAKPESASRQQTLRATIDWSYNLLTKNEKLLFRRLAPFFGSFSIDAAEHVTSLKPISKEQVLDGVAGLLDKSLLLVEEYDGQMRYRMLETVRQYARELLNHSREHDALHDRHLGFVSDLGAQARQGVRSENQVRWRNTFYLEMDSVRCALDWAFENGRSPALGARLACDVFMYWFEYGHFSEARSYLERANKLLTEAHGIELRVKTAVLSGALAAYMGDREGIGLIEEGVALAEEDQPYLLQFAVSWLGDAFYVLGEDELASEHLTRAMEMAERLGETKALGFMLASLSAIATSRGDFELAEKQLLRMLEIKKQEQDTKGIGLAHCHLGHLYLAQNRTGSHDHFRKGIAMVGSPPDYYMIGANLATASVILLDGGDPFGAAEVQGFSDCVLERTGATPDKLFVRLGAEVRERTKRALPNGEYQQAHKHGRRLHLDEVLIALGCKPFDPLESPASDYSHATVMLSQ